MSMVCDQLKEAGTKLNKGVVAKSGLIEWSQYWSLDLWDQVVHDEVRGGGGCWYKELLLQIDCTVAKWENILLYILFMSSDGMLTS
jgi:hypothetical protein